MSSPLALPTIGPFMDDHVPLFQGCRCTCDICWRHFNGKSRSAARLDGCHHVLCLWCLVTWFVSGQGASRKCPKCRKELFVAWVTLEDEGEATEEYEEEATNEDEERAILDSNYDLDVDVGRECVYTGLDCTSALNLDEEKDHQPPAYIIGSYIDEDNRYVRAARDHDEAKSDSAAMDDSDMYDVDDDQPWTANPDEESKSTNATMNDDAHDMEDSLE